VRGLALGLPFTLLLASCGGGSDACDPDAPNTICTVAGSGESGYLGDQGPATAADLYFPQDMIIGPNGNLWVSDFNNYLIREVDSQGMIHRIVGTPGLLGDSPDLPATTCPALEAQFNHTPTMVLDPAGGYLYLASWHNSRIKRVELATMKVENFAGVGKRTLYAGDEGPASSAFVDLPSSVAIDPAGNLTLMDQANMVIRQIDKAGVIHRIVGQCVIDDQVPCAPGQVPVSCGPGTDKLTCGQSCDVGSTPNSAPCNFSFGGDGGPATQARIGMQFGQQADPSGRIVYDRAGNLLFADTLNNRLRKVDTNGIITTIAGNGTNGYSGDGGPATAAAMSHPIDLTVADDGAIYFTDTETTAFARSNRPAPSPPWRACASRVRARFPETVVQPPRPSSAGPTASSSTARSSTSPTLSTAASVS
jgi:sugar lactone lactonase YvrE